MIEFVLAALLVQDQDGETPAETVERLGRVIERTEQVQEQAASESEAIVGFVAGLFEESTYGRFELVDQPGLVEAIAPHLATLQEIPPTDGSYGLDFAAYAFRSQDPAGSSEPYCAADSPNLIVAPPLQDAAGHEIDFRICWMGQMNPETNELTGSYFYQLQNGDYFVQYRAGISGPDEAGIRDRLIHIELMMEPIVQRTVVAPPDA